MAPNHQTQTGLPSLPKEAQVLNKVPQGELKIEGTDFLYFNKSQKWYSVVVLIGIILLGASVLLGYYYKQWPMVASVLVAFIVFLQLANRKPGKIECVINSSGVNFHNKTHPLANIKSFWIVPDQQTSTLYLNTTEKLRPTLLIHFNSQEAQKVFDYLSKFLPYEQTLAEEPSTWLSKWWRF